MRTFCRNLSIQSLGFVACLAAVVDKRRDKLGLDLQVSVNGRVTRGKLWADSIDQLCRDRLLWISNEWETLLCVQIKTMLFYIKDGLLKVDEITIKPELTVEFEGAVF